MTIKRPRRKPNVEYFTREWGELQNLCGSKSNWHDALIKADTLLDKALKQKHYKGKTTGERLVSAQHDIKTNDAVWYAHKYCQKLHDQQSEKEQSKINKNDALTVLSGFREALRDIGALEKRV